MDQQHRALRLGLAAILCGFVFRLCAMGLPEKLAQRLTQADAAAFLVYLETGRDVRFSPSLEAFSPDFMESPAPAAQEPTEAALPAFSDAQQVEVYNASGKSPDTAALLAQPLTWALDTGEPTVLILHTHATESYTKQGESYEESASWRTLDEDYNMLSIGAAVAALLEENGITVLQDRTLHDYPSYNGSYSDARQTLREYLEEYPSIQLVLDLHRDAAGSGDSQLRTAVSIGGTTSAQLMLVLGANHENYEQNLSLALKLHAQLEAQCPGITRPLQLRGARYNQDLCPGALLIEVGAAGNTHDEALLAAQELARAIVALAHGTA